MHKGTDFRASVGTPIYAPADGIVESVFKNDRGGNQLVLKHESGYTTGYAHLHEYDVKKGDRVKSGDIIAYTGNTGTSTGPHLHFTVKRYGDSLNPMDVLTLEPQDRTIENEKNKLFIWQNVIVLVVLTAIIFYLYKKI